MIAVLEVFLLELETRLTSADGYESGDGTHENLVVGTILWWGNRF